MDGRPGQHRDPGGNDRQLKHRRLLPGEPSHETGSGLIGTIGALLVFLILVFAAVQVLFDLYATSMVTSAAHDAARIVAGFDHVEDRCGGIPHGERVFSNRLGAYIDKAQTRLVWTCADPDVVRVRVMTDHPTMLPAFVAGLTGLGRVDRTIEVRVESVR